MKNSFKTGFVIAMISLLWTGCDPMEFDKSDAGINMAPAAEEMAFTITPGADEFHFVLKNLTPVSGVHTVKWDFGNGATDLGDEVIAYYPLPGTFDVTLTITVNSGDATTISNQLEQTETDYTFLDSPILNNLSGGSSASEGKTWVVDSLSAGHFGIGPADGNLPEWWAATPLQKTGSGAYDDEFTFKLVEFVFEYKNNGDSYVKDYQKTNSNYSNPVEVDGTDCRVDFTPAPAEWALTERNGVNYITLISNKPVFFGFDYGGDTPYEYRIDKLTEDELHLSTIGGDGNRWYNKLIRKGYVRPIVEKPIEENDLADNFEGGDDSNIVWKTSDIVKFEAISNFAPVPINESDHVAIYQKGAFEYTNVMTVLDYRLDLSTRNTFSMKVFIPEFNDYVTECNPGTDWLPTHNLKPQVDVKLQDSKKGGNAWETQEVRSHILTEDQLGKWVELEFDFSDVFERVDFDQVVIQIGAEGHCNPGIFYIDDFQLD